MSWRRRARRFGKRVRRRLLYGLASVGIPLSYVIPAEVALSFGEWAGRVGHRLASRERELALEQMRLALGDRLPEAEIRRRVRQMFENLGRVAAEGLLMARRPPVPLWRRCDATKFLADVDEALALMKSGLWQRTRMN